MKSKLAPIDFVIIAAIVIGVAVSVSMVIKQQIVTDEEGNETVKNHFFKIKTEE